MYKVFIENKPIIFQINSQVIDPISVDEIWIQIAAFLTADNETLVIDLSEDSDFIHVFESHKYIEAAGGMVERAGEFLFIKRNGVWDIPKGKLEKGESAEEGAVREIEEECGLESPEIKEHLADTWHTYEHKNSMVLKRTFWFWLTEGPIKKPLVPQGEEGITEVVYLPPSKFDQIRSNTYLSIIDVMNALEKKVE